MRFSNSHRKQFGLQFHDNYRRVTADNGDWNSVRGTLPLRGGKWLFEFTLPATLAHSVTVGTLNQ